MLATLDSADGAPESATPELVMRLMGPLLVLLTAALFATGIELWLFDFRFGDQWLTWHKAVFLLWFFAITVHVLAYVRRAPSWRSRIHATACVARWHAGRWSWQASSSAPRCSSRCCRSHRPSCLCAAPVDGWPR